MDKHREAINLLEVEIADLKSKLSVSVGDKALVIRISALLNSLQLLKQLADYEIAPRAKIYTLPLPNKKGHFSEFRLLDDNETENRNHWTEVELEGDPLRAIVGDILILNSEKRDKNK